MSSDPSPTDDFDTAKAVVDKLAGLSRERQARILRWVSEGLGLAAVSPVLPVAPVPAASGVLVSPPGAPPGTNKDIKSFITEKGPKSDNQFAAAVAYYYRFEAAPASRRDTIDGHTLQEAARLAGWKRPKRPTDTLNNARKAGYLDPADRGSFSLNNVGENLVAMALPAGTAPKSRRKKPVRGGKRVVKRSSR